MLIFSCHEYTGESDTDFLHTFFSYDPSPVKEWKLLDKNRTKIKLDANPVYRDSESKVIQSIITVYDQNMLEISTHDVLFWYGEEDQNHNSTPFFHPPKNLVNIINFIEKDKKYFIKPPQIKEAPYWQSFPEKPFSEKFINIKKDSILQVEKKKIYITNKNSTLTDKIITEHGIFGNIYDTIKFSRKKRVFRIYIEAVSEKNPNDIIKIDSGEKAIFLK